MGIIEFDNVWEKYRIKFISERKVSWEEIWALEDISFKVDRGEVLGVIGQNGAGKTTLLKLIAGMLIPDRGKVNVEGKVSVLMELGAGFNAEFTGRENIVLNARLYGLDEERLEEQTKKIIEFADIGKFIDAPIKYYSQGMYMRLAFALAIFVEPDILLIDDILAVGDEEAQQKCIKKIFELKQEGKTIVLISHDMNMISKLCNRVILLEKGKIIREDLPTKAIPYYLDTVGNKKGIAVLEKDKLRMVFNNGRINLSYNDYFLTKGMGGYISYFIPPINSWFSSLNLSWQIKSSVSDKIIAEGMSKDGVISQIWTIRIQDERLQWQVEIKEADVKEPHIDLVLVPNYKKWITLDKNGDFPTFAYKINWQDLGINECPDGIVGISPEEEIQNLPSLILEIEDKDSRIKLLNTGYEQEARIIQPHLNGNNFAMDIKIFPRRDELENSIESARSQFLLKQQQEQARIHSQRTLSSGNLRVFADLDNKSLRLYYKDKELTKTTGLHTSFLMNKTWYETSSAEWQIEKEQNSLILNLAWKHLKLTQTWILSFKENHLIWQVESEVAKPVDLELLKFGLSVIPEYKTFFCGHQQTNFPKEFTSWQDIPLEDPKAELFGLRKKNELPALTLSNRDDLICVVQNSNEESSCHILQLGLPKDTLKERILSFATELCLLEDASFIEAYIEEKKHQLLLKQKEERERIRLQRTISSGNLSLFADIETKALRLYYKDRELTKERGLHVSFLLNQAWYDLGSSEWQIKKEQDMLILQFYWKHLQLNQAWRFSFKDNSLLWEVSSKSEQAINFETLKFGLFLTEEYQTLFCGHQQTDFPKEFTSWQDIPLENPKAYLFGLRRENNLPAIVLENKQEFSCNVQNSDALTSCRILQLNIPQQSLTKERQISFSTRLKLLKDEALIEGYLKQEKAHLLASRTISSGNLRLFVDLDTKSLRLYFKDKELTQNKGLYTITYVKEKKSWFCSFDAQWQIQKISEEELILILNYESLLLLQIWTFIYKEQDVLEIKIELELNKSSIVLIRQDLRLELINEYRNWKTTHEQGNFLVSQYINDIAPIRLKNNKLSKIILSSNNNNSLPRLFFKTLFQLGKQIFNIYKCKDLDKEYICLNSSLLIPKKERLVNLGRYTYFEGKITLGRDIELGEEPVLRNTIELNKYNLRIVFDEGRGKIFWKQKELTTGLGIYTSVRHSGIWYDSFQSIWQTIETSKNKIVVIGEWPHIPISQTWQIELINKDTILWMVIMEIYEEIALEIEQANLMLSSEYKSWIIPGLNKGEFLEEYVQNYDILPFRFWSGSPSHRGIGVIDNNLPTILFKCNSENRFFKAIIENTDYIYKARLLQYQRSTVNILLPKKYPYFEGVIKIGHQK